MQKNAETTRGYREDYKNSKYYLVSKFYETLWIDQCAKEKLAECSRDSFELEGYFDMHLGEFMGKLREFEDNLEVLGVITKKERGAIEIRQSELYDDYKAQGDWDSYFEKILDIKPINSIFPEAAMLRYDVNWYEVPTIHTILNTLHQKLLASDYLFERIGEKVNDNIVILGAKDNYVDSVVELFKYKKFSKKVIIVNEGEGNIVMNIKDFGKSGHAGMISIDSRNRYFEYSLMLKSYSEGQHFSSAIKDIGLTAHMQNFGNYIIINGSGSLKLENFSVFLDLL
ncbi:MAG: hypothetical protein ACP5TL_01125 [Candidatus Micrarchaeia archaeon]